MFKKHHPYKFTADLLHWLIVIFIFLIFHTNHCKAQGIDSTLTFTTRISLSKHESEPFLFTGTQQQPSENKINSTRLWLLCGSMFVGNAAIMWYYFNTFYSPRESIRSKWHTFNDWYNSDMNMDKVGHIFGSQMYANTLFYLFRWTNMSERSSMIWSSSLALLYQLEMETTDGFYKKWGFSWWDVAANTIGSLLPNVQRAYPALSAINLKMSYYPSKAFRNGWYDYILKDYEGFTYWLTFNVHDLAPISLQKYLPSWLGIAVGYGITNSILGKERYNNGSDGKGGGDQEWYIAFDYDLRKLPGDSALLKFLKEELNLFHLPAPTIRFTPSRIYYGLFF